MNEKILVSISCITYNHEPYIRECLDGFIMQNTNFDFEILVHDDASTDKTQDIIREYEAKYPDIIKPIYQTENQFSKKVGSINAKFNYPRAKGKYIALCEGDDYWTDPLKLQKQVDYLQAHKECVLCFHDAITINQLNNKKIDKFKIPKKEKISTRDIIVRRWFVPTASIVFRAEVLPENYFFPDWFSMTKHGDLSLQLYLSKYGYLHAIEGKMSVYRFMSISSITLAHKDKNQIPDLISYTKFLSKVNKVHFNNKYLISIIYRWSRTLGNIMRHKVLKVIKK